MVVIYKKYGRWNESGNWQRESTVEKDVSFDSIQELANTCGFIYQEHYNECYSVSEDKLRMYVVCKK